MWSFIDFLIARVQEEELAEQLLLYVGVAGFVFFVFLLRLMMG